jgi:D-alanyl-D-alanine dipeptidase
VKLALLVASALAACGSDHGKAPPPSPPVTTTDAGAAATAAPKPFRVDAPELIVGVIDDWTSTTVSLRRWERAADRSWEPIHDAWPGVIGKAGAAWGDGLHGHGAPPGRGGPIKREGDKAAPAGVFALRKTYGYAAGAQASLGYQPVGPTWECVDDPTSTHYTQIVDRSKIASPDWTSFETMRRDDDLYTWVVDIAHNPAATPGGGSCIFFHVWGGEDVPTVGCTAMSEIKLARLIAEIDPKTQYVLLPRAEYQALAKSWGLPPL